MNPDSFSKKLYIPRNVEGKPNYKELAVLRTLEEQLSLNPIFIGLAPFGSSVSGYSGYSTEQSDIDICCMFAWSQEEADITKNQQNTASLEEIAKKVAKEKKIKIHFVAQNIGSEIIQEWVRLTGFRKELKLQEITLILSFLTRLGVGSKVQQYRKIYLEWLNSLSLEIKETIRISLLKMLLRKDDLSEDKRINRIQGSKKGDILDKRKKMWEGRITKIWGL